MPEDTGALRITEWPSCSTAVSLAYTHKKVGRTRKIIIKLFISLLEIPGIN
jgi:hypothetical protein